jgi:hypothetical protein
VKVHLTAGGRTRAVDISRNGDRFLVSLDGRQHEVDVKVINGVWSMLVGPAAAFARPELRRARAGQYAELFEPFE